MPKVSLVWFEDKRKLFYNVDAAVGPGASNQRTDVLLVQYFLREIFLGVEDFKTNPFPGGPVVVDGKPTAQTFAAILHFQKVFRSKFGSGATDGRVDPPVGEKFYGAISQAQYTILNMNIGYKKARPADWPRVSKASDCPAEIRALIAEPTFFGS